jgi:hypothetical protein
MSIHGQGSLAKPFLKAGMRFQEQEDAHLNHVALKICFSNIKKLGLKYTA